MTPTFRILADDADVSAVFHSRLLSMRINSDSGNQADSLEIRLDDRSPHDSGARIDLPRRGAALDLSLGYDKPLKMGRFIVDETELSAPPATLTVRAKSADMRSSLKQRKTRSWDDATIAQLTAAIAAEHDLLPAVGADLKDIPLPHIDQTDESDMHLLTRLGAQHNAFAKQAGDSLIFVRRASGLSVTSRPLTPVAVSPAQVGSYRLTLADRPEYHSVHAHWHDIQSGLRRTVSAGDGRQPAYSLRHNFTTAAAALHAAHAMLNSLNRSTAALSLSLLLRGLLIHTCGYNLSRLMRSDTGIGTPKIHGKELVRDLFCLIFRSETGHLCRRPTHAVPTINPRSTLTKTLYSLSSHSSLPTSSGTFQNWK